jgi:hypothetical protein
MARFQSNDNYLYVDIPERDNAGSYSIQPNRITVFPFSIRPHTKTELIVYQTASNMQDGSLRFWVSDVPCDNRLFTKYDSLNPVSLLRGAVHTISLYDVDVPNLPPSALILDSTKTYFANVQNVQAKMNAFRLILPA